MAHGVYTLIPYMVILLEMHPHQQQRTRPFQYISAVVQTYTR